MSTRESQGGAPSRNVGTQTLARGLRVLQIVAAAPNGVTTQDVADELELHRTIAYRILATLADFRLLVRAADGRYRIGAGLAALSQDIHRTLCGVAEAHMRTLARELQCTVSLLVAEDGEAVALAVVEPPNADYHLSFRAGSRHPLDRGSAAAALLAAGPAQRGESENVRLVRENGYVRTFGQVEPGAYGIAAPLSPVDGAPASCLNIITNREDIAERAAEPLLTAVERIDAALS